MDHSIHRLDEFLSQLARRQPELLTLLPLEERPSQGAPLSDWILCLSQRRMIEICSAWVLESMKRLRDESPLTNVILRGCLHLTGEFNIIDAGAVAIGEIPTPDHPRCNEIRAALQQAVRLGILIYLPREERYCIPFPVRLSYEGVDFLDPLERDTIRLRIIHYFGALAHDLADQPETGTPRYWRFANLMLGLEMGIDLMEELLGLEPPEWPADIDTLTGIPEDLATHIVDLSRLLGKSLVYRQSSTGARFLAGGVVAARSIENSAFEAEAYDRLGLYHFNRSSYDDAIKAYQRSEALKRAGGDHPGVIVAMSAVAIAKREGERPVEAIAEFLRACEYARHSGLCEAELDTANCAVQLMLSEGDAEKAIGLIQSVLESLKKSERRFPATAELLLHMGIAMGMEGRSAEAKSWLLSALGMARSFLHRPAEARCCLHLGRLFALCREHEEAVKWYRRARQVFVETSDYAGLSQTYYDLYKSIHEMTGVGGGSSVLEKALRSAERAADRRLLALVHGEKARVALDEGDGMAALMHYQRQSDALMQTRDIAGLVLCHLSISSLFFNQGSFLAAGAEALRAQALCRSMPHLTVPEDLGVLVDRTRRVLTPDQFENLVETVTGELESGQLHPRR